MLSDLASKLAKGAVGFLAGLLLWWALAAPYAYALATLSEPLIRVTERPSVTRLVARDTEVLIERTDFDRTSGRPGLLVRELTFNLIILTTLFAASAHPLRDQNIRGLLYAVLALLPVHIAAVIMNVQSIYALRLGAWSVQNYGPFARNFWGAAAHFYTIVGAFGAAFALWWMFRPPPDDALTPASRTARSDSKRRAAKR